MRGGPSWRTVALLGAASFIADISGEMLMAVLPFALLAQGATGLGLGLVGGMADAVGHVFKGVAGRLSDRTPRRLPWVIAGYVTAAAARFGIAVASVWGWSLAFRSLDRVGKGLRTAPRDAMLAEAVGPADRGKAFGFHRAADTAGAVVGVLLALVLTAALGESPATIILASAVIGFLTLVPLLGVRETPRRVLADGDDDGEPPSAWFGLYLVVVALFSLGNLSYLFYMVRSAELLGSPWRAILLYLGFNVVFMLAAYPFGRLADLRGRPHVLAAGYLLFSGAGAVFAWSSNAGAAVLGFAVLGLGFAAVEGNGRALAADLAGARARAGRLGAYHMTAGVATVVGGIAAGLIWDQYGPTHAFLVGMVAPLSAAVLLFVVLAVQRGRPRFDTMDL